MNMNEEGDDDDDYDDDDKEEGEEVEGEEAVLTDEDIEDMGARDLRAALLARKLETLEKQMHEHAKNLEFEEAAALRDQVAELKQLAFLN